MNPSLSFWFFVVEEVDGGGVGMLFSLPFDGSMTEYKWVVDFFLRGDDSIGRDKFGWNASYVQRCKKNNVYVKFKFILLILVVLEQTIKRQ